MDLLELLITTKRPYAEGAVEVFEQPLPLPGGAGHLVKAELCLTALGLYEAEIDGEKVGDSYFTPGFTYYPQEVQVQRYDVTSLLKGETPLLRVYLAQGWYAGRFGYQNKTAIYGEHPAVAWALEAGFSNGEKAVFTSRDGEVKSVPSPYRYAGFYDGEDYCEKGSGQEVLPPVPYEGKIPKKLSETLVTVKKQEEMPVVSVSYPEGEAGGAILDFGQNFAGIVEIDPAFMEGDALTIRHGEILNPDGTLYTANLRRAKATLRYEKAPAEDGGDRNASGKRYRPRFTYMGFRYAHLTGVPYKEGLIRAYALHTDMKRSGGFCSGNAKADRLYENTVWSQRSNYVEVPTDCPQRDERMGYTGDGQVFAETGAYHYDTEAFWKKFLRDIRSSQEESRDGYVMPTVPPEGPTEIGFISMMGWGSCNQIVPDLLYRHYGSKDALEDQYESMKKHVACELRRAQSPALPGESAPRGGILSRLTGRRHLWMSPNLGDWLAPGKDMKYMAMHHGPVSNAFLIHDLQIMSDSAKLLGKMEDAVFYEERRLISETAYKKAFIRGDGCMKDDYQGAYIMALAYVLRKEDALYGKVFARLVDKLWKEGMQTGFFSTQHLLPLLCEGGKEKLAYDLLLQEKCPGWMYEVNQGATTIWERWDAWKEEGGVNEEKTMFSDDNMVSFNHYAFGSVGAVYYKYILGIQALKPGFSEVLLRPFPDERLCEAKGFYESRSGRIESSWAYVEKEGKKTIVYDFSLPVPGFIQLPGEEKRRVEAGKHHFEV